MPSTAMDSNHVAMASEIKPRTRCAHLIRPTGGTCRQSATRWLMLWHWCCGPRQPRLAPTQEASDKQSLTGVSPKSTACLDPPPGWMLNPTEPRHIRGAKSGRRGQRAGAIEVKRFLRCSIFPDLLFRAYSDIWRFRSLFRFSPHADSRQLAVPFYARGQGRHNPSPLLHSDHNAAVAHNHDALRQTHVLNLDRSSSLASFKLKVQLRREALPGAASRPRSDRPSAEPSRTRHASRQ